MGFGFCRFEECDGKPIGEASTAIDFDVLLKDQDVEINCCGLWKHYAEEHNVLPPEEVREAVMNADPEYATTEIIRWRGAGPKKLSAYFVNPEGSGYNHNIGNKPDTEFINKLEHIIETTKKRKNILTGKLLSNFCRIGRLYTISREL